MKRTGRLRQRSKTNSRFWENLPLRSEYRESHADCEWPGHRHGGEHVHHICHSSRRHDLKSNLIHVCAEAHDWIHANPIDGTLVCLLVKVQNGELDVEEFFTAAGMRLAGWLSKSEPRTVRGLEAKQVLVEWCDDL